MGTSLRGSTRQALLEGVEAAHLEESATALWAQRLRTSQERSVLDAVDRLADNAIDASEALAPELIPRVRLLRLAKWLNARVEFGRQQPRSNYVPSVATSRATSTGAVLIRDPSGGWVVQAGARHLVETRFQVAHELGHALLYRDGDNVDVTRWRRTSPTDLEEAICDYMARRFLVPAALLRNPEHGSYGIAKFIVTDIVRPFVTSIELASLRWLDHDCDASRSVEAILLWRQYHPFDEMLGLVWARQCAIEKNEIRQLMAALRSALPTTSFSGAVACWHQLAHSSGDLPLGDSQETASEFSLIQKRYAGALNRLAEKVLRQLNEGDYSAMFRPEWIVWRSKQAARYVPCRRGSTRVGSIVQRLAAAAETVFRVETEKVAIGQLAGIFQVDAFAAGDPSAGNRYVLQVLQRT